MIIVGNVDDVRITCGGVKLPQCGYLNGWFSEAPLNNTVQLSIKHRSDLSIRLTTHTIFCLLSSIYLFIFRHGSCQQDPTDSCSTDSIIDRIANLPACPPAQMVKGDGAFLNCTRGQSMS